HALKDNTSWVNDDVFSRVYLLERFVVSVGATFADFARLIDPQSIGGAMLWAAPAFVIAMWMICRTARTAPRRVSAMVVAMAAVPIVALLLPDLVIGGRRSAPRYLIPTYIAVELATAWWLVNLWKLRRPRSTAQWASPAIAMVLFAIGLASCVTLTNSPTWWNKGGGAELIATATTL